MISSSVKQQHTAKPVQANKSRTYSEVVELLDSRWHSSLIDVSKETIKKLNEALGSPAAQLDTILVSGSNGKSLTINFVARLLKEEGMSVGSFYSPHITAYNERLSLNGMSIANQTFTEIANEVLDAAAQLNLDPHAQDILTVMALVYFKQKNVDAAILEVASNMPWDPATICKSVVTAVTRVTADDAENNKEMAIKHIDELAETISEKTWVVSADQSKFSLQTIQQLTESRGGNWAMPIRKLAALPYPFEQLHGRCAALAERCAQIFTEHWTTKTGSTIAESLLIKPKGQRGRPTLEAKRHAELNPKRTIEQFWTETAADMPGRFELFDKEKPMVLLDTASNFDAFNNVLLGIRLLNYQKPLKGLTVVLGCEDGEISSIEFVKAVRYFFKKMTGSVVLCPTANSPVNFSHESDWNVAEMTESLKAAKVNVQSAENFETAFDMACKAVDSRDGLVVVTGSRSIVKEYWDYKGNK